MLMQFMGRPDMLFKHLVPEKLYDVKSSTICVWIDGECCQYSHIDTFLGNWKIPERTCKMMKIHGDDYSFQCSECGKVINYFSKGNYCLNCGAKVVE